MDEMMPSIPHSGETLGGARYQQSSALLWRWTIDGVLVLRPGDDYIATLTGSATELWSLLGAPRTLDEVAGRLTDAFDAPAGRIREDIDIAINDLVARGIVEVVS